MSVDLRFSNVDPPAPEPKRSIYADLVNLPNPVYLGLTVRIFNYDNVGLYMRVDGYAAGWTFTTNDLGLLGTGADMYRNLDNFGNRSKPASAVSETITVRLRAYTDSGYTILKWTFERVIDVVFIKSDDGSWTQDFLNNFDDGTVQGWAVSDEVGNSDGMPAIGVVTDYVLSAPYSLRARGGCYNGAAPCTWFGPIRTRLYKIFTTPNRNNVFAIFDVRVTEADTSYARMWAKNIRFQNGDVVLVYLGRGQNNVSEHYYPLNKWMRVVVPLPKNVSVEVRVVWEGNGHNTTGLGGKPKNDVRMDDFRIISKD